MYLLPTILLFVATILLLVIFRATKRPFSFSWVTATLGSILILGSIFLWQLSLPYSTTPIIFSPEIIFQSPLSFRIDTYSWLFSLSFASLLSAVMLTSPVRSTNVFDPSSWIASIGLTGLGILTVLAANPFTLLLGWAAMDLAELINLLRLSDSNINKQRAISGFTFRSAGIILAGAAGVTLAANGQGVSFESNTTPLLTLILILSAGLRLGVIPLHITLRSDPGQRRGFGTILRLVTAASSIMLLVRIAENPLDPNMTQFLLPLVLLAGLYAAWNWLTIKGEIPGRPFFIIAASSLALGAAIGGNPTGAAIWGVILVLFGGISFLYSARRRNLSIFLGASVLLLAGLPFTLSAGAWDATLPIPFIYFPFFILITLILIAGFLRHLFEHGELELQVLPIWSQSIYPVGMLFLPIAALIMGLWGWQGSLLLGNLFISITTLVILLGLGFLTLRFRSMVTTLINTSIDPFSSVFFKVTDRIGAGINWSVDLFVALFKTLSNLLEGDGGLLWTGVVILLVLLSLRGV